MDFNERTLTRFLTLVNIYIFISCLSRTLKDYHNSCKKYAKQVLVIYVQCLNLCLRYSFKYTCLKHKNLFS